MPRSADVAESRPHGLQDCRRLERSADSDTMLTLLKPSHGSVRRDVQKKLPPYAWKRQPEHAYAAFLSHYKVEAGMEARYLKMELELS